MANHNPQPFSAPGPGRPKGLPNKATSEFKQALNKLLEDCAPDIQGWLREIAAKDKSAALAHVEKLAEYCHPKLARSENKTDANVTHKIVFGSGMSEDNS